MRAALQGATNRLREAGVGSPDHDALALLAHAWDLPVAEVQRMLVLGRSPGDDVRQSFDRLVEERERRVPLQHLTGSAAFRRLELAVGPGVFVPRFETEAAVDLALAACPPDGVLVDLCTGSGAIALACKQERPDLAVHAVEVDALAHAWAQRNRERLELDVDLRLGPAQSAFPELVGSVDVVVSNPPYIPLDMEPQDPEVRDHDPAVALYGGGQGGLEVPLLVAARAAQLLRPGGLLVMEHADTQGRSLPESLRREGWCDVQDHRDLAGRPRTVTARMAADPTPCD